MPHPDTVRVVRCITQNFPAVTSFIGLATGGHINDSDHYTGRAVDAMIEGWGTGWRRTR